MNSTRFDDGSAPCSPEPRPKPPGCPFVVAVRSNRFRDAAYRVIAPPLSAEEFGLADSDTGPHFEIADRRVVFDPRQITHVPRDLPGRPVAPLASEASRTVNALDATLSRA